MLQGQGEGSYLDAASVEPGVLRCWAHHGAVGLSVRHEVQGDEAAGGVVWSCLQFLLQVVLPAGAVGKRRGMGEGRLVLPRWW